MFCQALSLDASEVCQKWQVLNGKKDTGFSDHYLLKLLILLKLL